MHPGMGMAIPSSRMLCIRELPSVRAVRGSLLTKGWPVRPVKKGERRFLKQ